MTNWQQFKSFFVGSETARRPKKLRNGEKRIVTRKRQRMTEAYIWSPSMAYSKNCRLRDVSSTGARVEFCNEPVKIDELDRNLTLYIPLEKREIDCRIAWRKGRSIGIEFRGGYRPATRLYGSEARIG